MIRILPKLVLCLTVLLGLASTVAAGPYDGAYGAYKVITVTPTAVSGTLASQTDFPLLVRFKAKNSSTGSDVLLGSQNGGLDVRFTTGNGGTALSFERERWSDSAADFWVRLPVINGSGVPTTLRVYYGKIDADDASSSAAVFDTAAGFRAVYHMNGQSAGADESDATQNGFDATVFGGSGVATGFGGIGGARNFATHTAGDSSFFLVGRSQSNFGLHMKDANVGTAVGIGGLALYTTDGGATWSARKTGAVRTGTTQMSLNSVACAPNNTNLCYAVGGGSYPTGNNATRYIAKSTDGGNSWVKQDSAAGSQTFFGVSCNSDTSCVAVGGNATTTRYYSVLTAGGTSWSGTSGTSARMSAVYCIPGGTLCYAVGGFSTANRQVERYSKDPVTGAYTVTTIHQSSTTARLNGIHCLDADNCYVVGIGGIIYKNTNTSAGGTFNTLTSGTTKNLNAIHCTDLNTCVAVGNAIGNSVYVDGDVSAILKTTDGGATWASKSVAGVNDSLYAVRFTSANKGIIVGANGIVLRTTDGGEVWTINGNSRRLALNVNGAYDFGTAGSGSGKGDNYSISSWANVNSATGGQMTILGKGDFHWTQQVASTNVWNSAERNWMACTGTPATMCAFNGNTNWQNAEAGMTVTTGWHHIVSRRKNSVDSGMVYVDGGTMCGGSQVAAANAAGGGVALQTANRAFLDIVGIGRGTDAYRRFWRRGPLDEIRVDGVDRNPSWICLSYQTQTPDTAAYFGKVVMGAPVSLRRAHRTGVHALNVVGAHRYAFEIPAGSAEAAELRVVDVAGRTVWSSAVRPNGKASTISWDGRDAAGNRVNAGVYFARLKTVNQGKTSEFALKGMPSR